METLLEPEACFNLTRDDLKSAVSIAIGCHNFGIVEQLIKFITVANYSTFGVAFSSLIDKAEECHSQFIEDLLLQNILDTFVYPVRALLMHAVFVE